MVKLPVMPRSNTSLPPRSTVALAREKDTVEGEYGVPAAVEGCCERTDCETSWPKNDESGQRASGPLARYFESSHVEIM
jgi:hypothetical protein